jgi:FAD:protein FMN transferase
MTLAVAPTSAQWSIWSTTARLVVTDPDALATARSLVDDELDAIERAASRFRADSEVNRLHLAGGRPQRITWLLAEMIAAALEAADRSGGDVDPTVGNAMRALGYDRDFAQVSAGGGPVQVAVRPAPGWQRVHLSGQQLTLPPGVLLDLGATAKAFAADRCAALITRYTGSGALVSLGGDIATAGAAPAGGWRVLVQDRPADPSCTVTLPAGHAIATSSTVSRQWRQGERLLHHVLDPRNCQPAEPVWRTVTVAAPRCLTANTLTTAALVRGREALSWLRDLDVPARLVTAGGEIRTTARWPRHDRGGEQ